MSETEIVIVLGDIQGKLVDEVQRICAPMFMLFDFLEFAREVYEDIVRRFEKGEASERQSGVSPSRSFPRKTMSPTALDRKAGSS